MTGVPTFPVLAGQGISVHKKPRWDNIVAQSASGRETRARRYLTPLWDFELTFDGLDSTATGQYGGLGAASLQNLAGFFLQQLGQYSPFLYVDPTDFSATGQILGVGDGTTTSFTFVRAIGPYVGPVDCVTAVSKITVGGVTLGGAWTATGQPPVLTFLTPPALGAVVTADFTYAYVVRFSDDVQDFEEFMTQLHELKTVRLMSSRSPPLASNLAFGPGATLHAKITLWRNPIIYFAAVGWNGGLFFGVADPTSNVTISAATYIEPSAGQAGLLYWNATFGAPTTFPFVPPIYPAKVQLRNLAGDVLASSPVSGAGLVKISATVSGPDTFSAGVLGATDGWFQLSASEFGFYGY